MARELYKLTIYQDAVLGDWRVGNYSHLGQMSNAWYLPARALQMDLVSFVDLLINEYHVKPISYTEYDNGWSPLFQYKWTSYQDAHSFMLRVNKAARDNHFYIDWAD